MFLTTRKDSGLYKILINTCKLDAENQSQKKLNLHELKLKKFPSIDYLINFFFFIVSGKIFSDFKCLKYKYKNISIGRFVLAEIFKNPNNFNSKIISTFNKFITFLKAGRILATCNKYDKYATQAIFIDHCFYLNGIYYSYFVKKKLIIYTNNFPRSIIRINIKNRKKFRLDKVENIYKIPYKKIKFNKTLVRNKIKKMTTNPKIFLPWLKNTKYFKDKTENYRDYDYLIYCHSFTDAQLIYGDDDFSNSYEWLDFTLNFLKEKKSNSKVLIKPHPNFWNNYLKNKNSLIKYDNLLFKKIFLKYRSTENFSFIKKPIFNYELMQKLDNKRCVLISHHGSVIFEANLMKFKTIFSQSSFWSHKYKISNTWNSKNKYENLLNKKWTKLKFANNSDFYSLFNKYFFDNHSYFGKYYWQKILCKHLGMNWVEFTEQIEHKWNKLIPKNQWELIIKKTLKGIETIND